MQFSVSFNGGTLDISLEVVESCSPVSNELMGSVRSTALGIADKVARAAEDHVQMHQGYGDPHTPTEYCDTRKWRGPSGMFNVTVTLRSERYVCASASTQLISLILSAITEKMADVLDSVKRKQSQPASLQSWLDMLLSDDVSAAEAERDRAARVRLYTFFV